MPSANHLHRSGRVQNATPPARRGRPRPLLFHPELRAPFPYQTGCAAGAAPPQFCGVSKRLLTVTGETGTRTPAPVSFWAPAVTFHSSTPEGSWRTGIPYADYSLFQSPLMHSTPRDGQGMGFVFADN
ncbi:hypothetical protein NDU88_001991 [Pleurodeles waltl]|uniref:Uncharacterized protein n=1 Tax=Pleurodeles waltl TaxID=8319 RepID=A0AAV7WJZ9_PLEWA|nr:hypothetical protein NDU88_001991 [Pleurodeles waltl]